MTDAADRAFGELAENQMRPEVSVMLLGGVGWALLESYDEFAEKYENASPEDVLKVLAFKWLEEGRKQAPLRLTLVKAAIMFFHEVPEAIWRQTVEELEERRRRMAVGVPVQLYGGM